MENELRSPATASTEQNSIFTDEIGHWRIGSGQTTKLTLGVFSAARPAKGFSVEINPHNGDDDAVTASIHAVGHTTKYELVLQVTNNSEQAIAIKVRQLGIS